MNTRILKMCRRGLGRSRHVPGLGQLQPVTFGYSRGRVTFRCEDVSRCGREIRPCMAILPLPRNKEKAKRLFALLERCKLSGEKTPAYNAYMQETRNRQNE